MPRLNFADESYELDTLPEDAKRLVNLYRESAPQDARAPFVIRSTPGLQLAETIGTGPILAINADQPGTIFVVSGNALYGVVTSSPTTAPTFTLYGDIGVTGPDTLGVPNFVTIAVGVVQGVVCVPPNAYYFDFKGNLTQITDPNFPGASSVSYMDGFFVFTDYTDDSRYFCSNLLDASTYNALNYAYADGHPNVVRRILQNKGNLWLFGAGWLEAWYDAGLANFPFTKRLGSDISFPCVSPMTPAICDDSIFYLAANGAVYRIDGAQPKAVSTFAIERWILNNNDFVNVDAYGYHQGTHAFYVLNFFGTTPRTYVYDAKEDRWHERASGAGATGGWLPKCAAMSGSTLLFGDRVSANLYSISPTVAQDNGQQLTRIATLPPLWGGTKRAFMARLELEMQTGIALTNNAVLLEISDDGGLTYRQRTEQNSGPAGNGRYRVFWTMLGSFRERFVRFTLHDLCALYAADAEIQEGVW